jgi:hypothetical protein
LVQEMVWMLWFWFLKHTFSWGNYKRDEVMFLQIPILLVSRYFRSRFNSCFGRAKIRNLQHQSRSNRKINSKKPKPFLWFISTDNWQKWMRYMKLLR